MKFQELSPSWGPCRHSNARLSPGLKPGRGFGFGMILLEASVNCPTHAVASCCCSKDQYLSCCQSKAQLGSLSAGKVLQLWAWCCWLSGTWGFLRYPGSHRVISAVGKEIPSHSVNPGLAICGWQILACVCQDLKNVDGLMSKKTFLDVLLLEGKKTHTKYHPTKTEQLVRVAWSFYLYYFPSLPFL